MNELLNLDDLNKAVAASTETPVFLFKHSTRCPISLGAFQRVKGYLAQAGAEVPPFYLVKVIESRPVSNEIAARLGVPHQSPQLILLRNQQSVWDASHGDIDAAAITRAITQSA